MSLEEKFDADIRINAGGRRVAWNESYSPYGYRLSETMSATFKEVRRGNDEMAVYWAYQMMISGSEAEDFLWEHIKVAAVEDVGLADPHAISIVTAAEELYNQLPSKSIDRFTAGAFAITYLSHCSKTRYSHELLTDVQHRLREGWKPPVPDYAIDVHLPHARKEKGRDLLHYLTVGAKLKRDNARFTKKYRKRLIKRAKASRKQNET